MLRGGMGESPMRGFPVRPERLAEDRLLPVLLVLTHVCVRRDTPYRLGRAGDACALVGFEFSMFEPWREWVVSAADD
jgi:hypothetical protein